MVLEVCAGRKADSECATRSNGPDIRRSRIQARARRVFEEAGESV
jgi:hypothetical protein